jgi:diadenosine tetraphosphate (Ap4A) HIT family hydrolase
VPCHRDFDFFGVGDLYIAERRADPTRCRVQFWFRADETGDKRLMNMHSRTMLTGCHFCGPASTVEERCICDSAHARAFLSNAPIVPGHTLIVPSRCVGTLDELYRDELEAMLELRARLKGLLKSVLDAEGFNFAWNEGFVAGQTVPHLHLHMVPRRKGDTGVLGYDPRERFYRPGSRACIDLDELSALAHRLRSFPEPSAAITESCLAR